MCGYIREMPLTGILCRSGKNELWRQIILNLAEQNMRLADRVIQVVFAVARINYWDVFPFDSLLDMTAVTRRKSGSSSQSMREKCQNF